MNKKIVVGMIRYDLLLHILEGLQLTGGCDDRTLAIVARAIGLGEHYRAQPIIAVEMPKTELLEGEAEK